MFSKVVQNVQKRILLDRVSPSLPPIDQFDEYQLSKVSSRALVVDLASDEGNFLDTEIWAIMNQDKYCNAILALDDVTKERWALIESFLNDYVMSSNCKMLTSHLMQILQEENQKIIFDPETEFDPSANPIEGIMQRQAIVLMSEPNTKLIRVSDAFLEAMSPLLAQSLNTQPSSNARRNFPTFMRLNNGSVSCITFIAIAEMVLLSTSQLFNYLLKELPSDDILRMFQTAADLKIVSIINAAVKSTGSKILSICPDPRQLSKEVWSLFEDSVLTSFIASGQESRLLMIDELQNSVTPFALEKMFASGSLREPEWKLLRFATLATREKFLPEAKAKGILVELERKVNEKCGENAKQLNDEHLALYIAWPFLRHIRLATIDSELLESMLKNNPLFPEEFSSFIIKSLPWNVSVRQKILEYKNFWTKHPEYMILLRDLKDAGSFSCPLHHDSTSVSLRKLYPNVSSGLEDSLDDSASESHEEEQKSESNQGPQENSRFGALSNSPFLDPTMMVKLKVKPKKAVVKKWKPSNLTLKGPSVWPIFSILRRKGNSCIQHSDIITQSHEMVCLQEAITAAVPHVKNSTQIIGRCLLRSRMQVNASAFFKNKGTLEPDSSDHQLTTIYILKIHDSICVFITGGFTVWAIISSDPTIAPSIGILGKCELPEGDELFIKFGQSVSIKGDFERLNVVPVTVLPVKPYATPEAKPGCHEIESWEIHQFTSVTN